MHQRIAALRDCFQSGATLKADFRRGQLEALRRALKAREPQLLEALRTDLGKASFEGYATELGMVYEAVSYTHLSRHTGLWSANP